MKFLINLLFLMPSIFAFISYQSAVIFADLDVTQ